MANEEKKNLPVNEKAEPGKFSKFVKGLVAIPKRMKNALMNTWAELKKVTWPSRKELINSTGIVLAVMVGMAIIIGVLDLGATQLVSLVIR